MNKVRRYINLDRINDANRSVFGWLVRPLVLTLWPRRENRLVRSIPNIISTLRIPASLAVVVLLVYPGYVNRDYSKLYVGLTVLVLLLISDGIDGAIARGLLATSTYGKAMDPIADKVLYLSGVIALLLGSRSLVGNKADVALALVLLPAVYYEIRLVLIALVTKRECDKREAAEPVGANSWGKSKFAIQAVAIFIGLGIPWLTLGLSLTTALIALSLPFAHFSLRGHQLDLEAIKIKPIK